jgi:TonB family protein
MASPTRLEARVAAILDATKPRQSLRRNNMTVYTCVMTLLLLPLSALTSLAHPLPEPGAMAADLNGSLTAIREATSHSSATAKLRAQVAANVNKLEAAVAANRTESRQPVAAPATAPVPEPFAAAQNEPPSRIRVGGNVQQTKLIKKVNPRYPPEAKAEGVQGTVRLNVRIDKEGFVVETEVEKSPDDRLSESAVEAVRQWVYAPTLLNGNPVEVLTVIDVNYTLQK